MYRLLKNEITHDDFLPTWLQARLAEWRRIPPTERDLETIWTHTRQQWGVEKDNRYIDIFSGI